MYKINKFIFEECEIITAPTICIRPNIIDVPEDIKEGIVYVDNENKIAALKCACGCGEIIALNLIPDSHPSWNISGNTIKPSIQRTIGCRSHFSVINGEVK